MRGASGYSLQLAAAECRRFSFRSKVIIDFRKALAARLGRNTIGREWRERRSLEQACADLRAKYMRNPTVELARMIEQLQAEIDFRQAR